MENRNAEANISLVLTRVLPAPPEEVFRAWTEAEQLKKWFGPEGCKVPLAEADARVGGKYRIGIKPPDGDDILYVGGVFREVNPPARVSFTWQWENEGLDTGESLVTVELRPQGDGTELTLTHERFASEESRENHNKGWASSLNDLEALFKS